MILRFLIKSENGNKFASMKDDYLRPISGKTAPLSVTMHSRVRILNFARYDNDSAAQPPVASKQPASIAYQASLTNIKPPENRLQSLIWTCPSKIIVNASNTGRIK